MTNETARAMIAHTNMFGSSAIVKKLGRGWIVDFRGHGFPTVFKTKAAAIQKAQEWRLAVRVGD